MAQVWVVFWIKHTFREIFQWITIQSKISESHIFCKTLVFNFINIIPLEMKPPHVTQTRKHVFPNNYQIIRIQVNNFNARNTRKWKIVDVWYRIFKKVDFCKIWKVLEKSSVDVRDQVPAKIHFCGVFWDGIVQNACNSEVVFLINDFCR